jgi:anthranilate synthase/aminodeoxychorismate synthase-like glutamine amidotransferase
MANLFFIDNFDSFTYNLVDEFEKRNCKVEVYRNNISMGTLERKLDEIHPELIVLSPGPSSPQNAGNCINIVQKYKGVIPIFGVCLGHQIIIEAFGGKVDKAPEPVHGKSSYIAHDGKSIFRGLSNPLHVARYHSLCGVKIPDSLEVSAEYNGINMGVRNSEYRVEGVQFHPESILTSEGGKIIENLLNQIGWGK